MNMNLKKKKVLFLFDKKMLSLYLVTDDELLKGRNFFDVIEDAVKGGVTMVQLREKNSDSRAFYEKALKCKEITEKYQIPLIINDRIDIALAVNADGIHVGQRDIPVEVVKKIAGNTMIVGATANTVELAKEAQKQGADYVGAGAVFPTSTKLDAKDLSLETLKKITKEVSIPVVAIGGISYENAENLKNTKIAGIAVSSAIIGKENVQEASEKLKKIVLSKIIPLC